METHRYPTLDLYRRLLAMARPYALHILGVLLLSLLAAPVALLTPVPMKLVVDSVIGGAPVPSWLTWLLGPAGGSALPVAIIVLVAVGVVSQIQSWSLWVLQTYTSEQLLLRFRSRLFAHVQQLSFTYHDRYGSADSTYRIQYDAMSIQSLVLQGTVPFATSSMLLLTMLAVTARLDWIIACVSAAVVPPLFALVWLSRGRLRDQWGDIKRNESSAMSVVQEVLGSLRVVKAFGQEEREYRRFMDRASRTMHGNVRLARTQGTFDLLVAMTITVGMGFALFLGARHVQVGVLSLGDLVLVIAYLTQVLTPVADITKRIATVQGALAAAARAFALLDQAPEVVERPHAKRLAHAKGAVSCRDVSFAYDNGHEVLHHVAFEVQPGERVGIAGHTGAGKTTLVNLLTRFHDPTGGAILLDGVDLRDYKLTDLRTQFSVVLQEPVLFSTSLRENIAYARPDATLDQIIAAAKAAAADEFISALPEGYDTLVGERGLSLSGGERQRISLARAFLKDAPLLILDEPTSSIDLRTEADIMNAMERLMRGRTTFIIAHRLNTLDRCDVRLVLADGRLVESTASSGLAAL